MVVDEADVAVRNREGSMSGAEVTALELVGSVFPAVSTYLPSAARERETRAARAVRAVGEGSPPLPADRCRCHPYRILVGTGHMGVLCHCIVLRDSHLH